MAVSGRYLHKVNYCAANRTMCFRVVKSLMHYQLILVQPITEFQLLLVDLSLTPCMKTSCAWKFLKPYFWSILFQHKDFWRPGLTHLNLLKHWSVSLTCSLSTNLVKSVPSVLCVKLQVCFHENLSYLCLAMRIQHQGNNSCFLLRRNLSWCFCHFFFNGIFRVASSVLADISCFQFCWWTSVVFLSYRDQLRSSPSFMLYVNSLMWWDFKSLLIVAGK